MKRAHRSAIALLLAFSLRAGARAAEMREWTDRLGQKFQAEIIANDAWRATFAVPGKGKAVVPLAQLCAADVAFVAKWRRQNPAAPLVDAEKLAPWPAEAVAANVAVRLISEDPEAHSFLYEGAHFSIHSDVKLPAGVIADLNAVFEATREALMALPFGFHPGGETERYRVFLHSTAEAYGRAGGATASGGYYDGANDRMLILLPNLGIHIGVDQRNFDYRKNLFVLKHEVTHQLLRFGGRLPMWFNEGIAEVVAATPFAQGRYTFSALDTAIGKYVQKWRSPGELKPMLITPPGALMSASPAIWEARVSGGSAYEFYNSAALFTYFILRHDGAGDGKAVAAFLNALRSGDSPEQAVAIHIRRGRTDEKLEAEFSAFLKRLRLRFEFEPSPVPR